MGNRGRGRRDRIGEGLGWGNEKFWAMGCIWAGGGGGNWAIEVVLG